MTRKADSVRFVLFDSLKGQTNTLALWQKLFDVPPTGFQASHQPGMPSFSTGDVKAYSVTLLVQDNRVEAILQGSRQHPNAVPQQLENENDAIDFGREIFSEMKGLFRFERVALVVELSEIVETERAAFEKLRGQLQFVPEMNSAKDTIFQINRPIESSVVEGVSVNRLCRWITAVKQLVQMQMGPGMVPSQSPTILRSQNVFSIAFDLNSTSKGESLSDSESDSLIQELISEMLQLMSVGYDGLR